jgi:ADP-ribosylation factor GTPase-activating protein 1
MDKWANDQLERMKRGGNRKAIEFFKSQSGNAKILISKGWREGMSIQDKYTSDFARAYKEKLTCDVEGRPFIPSDIKPFSSQPHQPNSTMIPDKEMNEDYFRVCDS